MWYMLKSTRTLVIQIYSYRSFLRCISYLYNPPAYVPSAMERRTFAKAIGGIAVSAAAIGAITQDSQAVRMEMETFSIPDEEVRTATPVNGVTLNVGLDWSYETSTTPTRVVLRLRSTYATETHQLAATEIPGTLEPQQSGEHTFNANLLSHPRITAPALTPTEVGETSELTFDLSITMTVYGESGKLGSETISDTATISVYRKKASVEATLSATGTIDVSTKTPHAIVAARQI